MRCEYISQFSVILVALQLPCHAVGRLRAVLTGNLEQTLVRDFLWESTIMS